MLAAALWLSAAGSASGASVTLGQLPPTTPMGSCSTQRDATQPTVTSGNPYVVPATNGIVSWAVTSWSTFASADLDQNYKMKLFQPVSGMTYRVVAHDVPHDLTPGVVNTFATDLTAKPGDIIGVNNGTNPGNDACAFVLPMGTSDSSYARGGDLADGEQGDFGPSLPFFRTNISAVITPTSKFSLGAISRNRKKGTALLAVNVPNPGEVALSGKGLRSAGAARAAVATSGPGTVSLLIKARGKKLRKLNQAGKVKVAPQINFTPTGGDPSTQSSTLKLIKKP